MDTLILILRIFFIVILFVGIASETGTATAIVLMAIFLEMYGRIERDTENEERQAE